MHLEIKWFDFYAWLPIQSLVFTDKKMFCFFLFLFLLFTSNLLTKSSHPDSKGKLVIVAKLPLKKKKKRSQPFSVMMQVMQGHDRIFWRPKVKHSIR